MARRSRRRSRRFHGITSLNLSAFPVSLDDSVTVMDVLIGAAVGLLGAGAVKGGFKKFAPDMYNKVAGVVGPAIPILTGGISAALLYYAQKGSARARGHAVGAALAGVTLTLQAAFAKMNIPMLDFNEVVSLNLSGMGGYNGLLVSDTSDALNGFNGLIVDDKSDSLNELAAYSMGEEDDDGLASLAGM